MEEKLIITDCDGVLVSWNNGFHEWLVSMGYTQKNDQDYNIDVRYGISKEEASYLVCKFNDSPHIADLKPIDSNVKHSINLLNRIHGYRFVVITSLSSRPLSAVYRRNNLFSIFGQHVFKDVICLPCGGDKTEELKKYENQGLYWIEDKLENAELGASLGYKTILYQAPYNQSSSSSFTRLRNWIEIYNHIVKDDSGTSR